MFQVFRVAGVAKKLRFPSALSLCRQRVLCELGESSCASIAQTARLLNLTDLETAALEFTQTDNAVSISASVRAHIGTRRTFERGIEVSNAFEWRERRAAPAV
ncbi:hypothetical protein Bbelb_236530 [Branchiostoma belcheri]|nr:hypothetical protein Bbelb_236530 [Branchiostoma belcheri]